MQISLYINLVEYFFHLPVHTHHFTDHFVNVVVMISQILIYLRDTVDVDKIEFLLINLVTFLDFTYLIVDFDN